MTFDTLEPDARACALVGYFLQTWAHVEEILTEALGLILDITPVQRAILLDEIFLAKKLGAMRELVPLLELETQEAARLKKSCKALFDLNQRIRVPLAHRRFGYNDDNALVIFSSLDRQPLAQWTTDQFVGEVGKLVGASRPFYNLSQHLGVKYIDKRVGEYLIQHPHLIASLLSTSGSGPAAA